MKGSCSKLAAVVPWVAGFAVLALCGAQGAAAQPKSDPGNSPIAGSWKLVSNVNTAQDGKKSDIFGSDPKGIALFSNDGHFAVVNTRAGLPKFRSGSRMQGTPEENQAIVQGSIALYGRYSVDPKAKVITLKVESSTWPSWTGTEQKRNYTLAGDELKWTLQSSVGGTAEVAWKRIK